MFLIPDCFLQRGNTLLYLEAKGRKHNLFVKPKTIRKVLEDLHIDEEDEVIIRGDFGDWGYYCNIILFQVLERKKVGEKNQNIKGAEKKCSL